VRRALGIAAILLALAAGVMLLLRARDDGDGGASERPTGVDARPGEALPDAGRSGGADLAPAAGTSPEPPEAPTVGPRITGVVVDGAERAVVGARVRVVPDTASRAFSLADEPSSDDVAGSHARTGADGRFSVRVSTAAPFHVLFVGAEGHSLAVRTAVAAGADVRVVLLPALSLVGTVRDREAKPVAGARVHARELVDTARSETVSTTREDGTYRLDGLYRASESAGGHSRGRWLEVTADGFAPSWIDLAFRHDEPDPLARDVVLSRGATIAGP
jgi:hypothetical protein